MCTKATDKRDTGEKPETEFVPYDQLWGLFDDLQMGVFTVDSDRRITSFNRAAQVLTGYNEKEVIGQYCHQVFHNAVCFGDCKFHEAVEAEKKSLSFDVEISDRQGEKHLITKIVTPLYGPGRAVTGCIEIFQDRSAFKELLNRIRYDEQQQKMILESLDIGVFTVSRSGIINFFNRQAETISGFNRAELLGKPCVNLLGGPSSQDIILLNRSIEDGTTRSNDKSQLTAKDGGTIPIRASFMGLRNEQGRIIGGLVTVQDLSLIHRLNREIKGRFAMGDMIGKAPSIQKIFEIVPVVASSDATVLIEGPTGTGKDLLARVVHNQSSRSGKAFVKVNCAALPDNLLESEMFGYAKGAFTGADRDKPGRFQEADGGTIFLDEIGDLPLPLQAKLLRVIEDKEFYGLGSRKITRVDVRIIAATNRGLERLVEEKRFREDLFYRLNVIRLDLPPLKERREDIPLLIEHILKRLCALKRTSIERIAKDTMEVLLNYDYPGNIREMENILEHALIVCQGDVIEKKHLPLSLQMGVLPRTQVRSPAFHGGDTIRSDERNRILAALKRNNWNRSKTAQDLNMERTTLWRKMKKHQLTEH
jgi:two-component system response regulator HydG